ncbi:MAG: hypothetical protein ACI9OI_002031, partial [Chitinophagales bacterium]
TQNGLKSRPRKKCSVLAAQRSAIDRANVGKQSYQN